jgi:iron complex outermembrane receptor protein
MDLAGMLSTGNDPDYNAQIRSQMDLPAGVDVDLALRAVDELPRPHTEGYVDADARLGWQVTDTVELSLVGRNLLHEAHPEIIEPPFRQQVRRSVYAGLRWSF